MAYTDVDSTYRVSDGGLSITDNQTGVSAIDNTPTGAYTYLTRDAKGDLLAERNGTAADGAATNDYYLTDTRGSVITLTDITVAASRPTPTPTTGTARPGRRGRRL